MANMERTSVHPTTRFHGRLFQISRLRDAIGPSNPLYELIADLCVVDIVSFKDEFDGTLNTAHWTAANSGGAGAANFALVADAANGVIQAGSGTTDDGSATLFQGNEIWASEYRPVVVCGLWQSVAVTASKFEFGFQDAAGPMVNVKATPTSTGTDYCVIVRDTDDDTSVDMVCDGTTDAAEKVASSPGLTWAAATTPYTLMLGIDETRVCRFWINGVYQGRSTRGPDNAVPLGIGATIVERAAVATTRLLNIDYVKAWQQRASQA